MWRLRLVFLVVALAGLTRASSGESLTEAVFAAGLQHLREHGPDMGTETFISHTAEQSWRRRGEVAEILTPHLAGEDAAAMAAALRGLYRLCWLPEAGPHADPEEVARFHLQVDKAVYGQVDSLFALADDAVLKSLALYCGSRATADGKQTLWRIVESPHAKNARSQALICIAWHRDAGDLPKLLPLMLEDSRDSSVLPYHFRASYGEASTPYLRQAVADAQQAGTRLRAACELVRQEDPVGYQHLLEVLGEDPEPDGKRSRPAELVRQFARDRLPLPKGSSSDDAVADFLSRKLQELAAEGGE